MLVVKNYVKESKIKNAGLGLFAGEFIKENSIIWIKNHIIDKFISQAEYNSLPDNVKDFFNTYSYRRIINDESFLILSLDNDRFTNHSDDPNTYCDDEMCYASRDIKIDEEILTDYNQFDLNAKDKLTF